MINKDDKVFFLNVPEKKKFLLDFSRRADIRNPVMYIHLKNGDIVELTLSGNLKIPKEIEGFKEILKNINYEVIIMTCGIRYERGDITITYNKNVKKLLCTYRGIRSKKEIEEMMKKREGTNQSW